MSPAKKNTGTWVYCLLRSARAPLLKGAPKGPGGTGPARAVEAGDGLWLVVADAPLDVFGDEPLNLKLKDLDWVSECALRHEGVVEFARKKGKGVLPLKLFTLFHSDERALSWTRGEKKRLVAALERVSGCSEVGVRMTLDERKARARAEADLSRAAKPAGGAAFLLRKKQVRDVSARLTRSSKDLAQDLFDDLAKLAKDARRRGDVEGLSPGSRLCMDGVFLVPDGALAKFKAQVKKSSAALQKDGFDVAVTGPWPPYHFVTDAA